MRVAALYDIHGNLPALEAVLAEVEAAAPDLIVVGGDVVAGPLPAEALDRRVGGKRVINAGSVGRPYEDGPAGYWLWLGADLELRRTDYDIGAAVRQRRPGVRS